MSGSLVRSLEDEYVIGTYGQGLFIVFSTNSYETAFGELLSYEKKILTDLEEVFKEKSQSIIETATGTTATSSKKIIDKVVYNQSVRELVDSTNNVILLYGLINQNTIIFAENEQVFIKIIDEINASKRKQ